MQLDKAQIIEFLKDRGQRQQAGERKRLCPRRSTPTSTAACSLGTASRSRKLLGKFGGGAPGKLL